ncbi:MAG: Formate hydrogenlyase subunit 5 precursor [Candidatus Heimdallarchaeota archaeon LC_2]|nr:MAG: Formate hydrogenlyase subunit 5 precursor [Candidatus Heimdallarchaeota archaeon LC_2]
MKSSTIKEIIKLKDRGYNLISIGYLGSKMVQYTLFNYLTKQYKNKFLIAKLDRSYPSIENFYPNAKIFEYEVNQSTKKEIIEIKKPAIGKWELRGPPKTSNFNFEFYVKGESVIKVETELGFSYRTIEANLKTRAVNEVPNILANICGFCSTGHTLAYCLMLESMMGITDQITERTNLLRILFSEVERILNHLLWIGISVSSVGLNEFMSKFFKIRKKIEDVFVTIKKTTSLNRIGGINANIDKLPHLSTILKFMQEEILDIEFHIEYELLRDYTKNVSRLTQNEMENIGAVGPIARSSNIAIDVRSDRPYSGYLIKEYQPIVVKGGDLFSIIQIKFSEIVSSINLSLDIMDNLPSGNTKIEYQLMENGNIVQSWVEAPSGILQYTGRIKKGRLDQLHINVPTINNLMPMIYRFKKSELMYLPMILRGIDMGYDPNDNLTFVDLNNDRIKQITGFELTKKSAQAIKHSISLKFSDL